MMRFSRLFSSWTSFEPRRSRSPYKLPTYYSFPRYSSMARRGYTFSGLCKSFGEAKAGDPRTRSSVTGIAGVPPATSAAKMCCGVTAPSVQCGREARGPSNSLDWFRKQKQRASSFARCLVYPRRIRVIRLCYRPSETSSPVRLPDSVRSRSSTVAAAIRCCRAERFWLCSRK